MHVVKLTMHQMKNKANAQIRQVHSFATTQESTSVGPKSGKRHEVVASPATFQIGTLTNDCCLANHTKSW